MHLESCVECRALYGSLQRVLGIVDAMPLPARGPEYGAEVWKRLDGRLLGARRPWSSRLVGWLAPQPIRWASAAAAFSVLLTAAFLAGRFYPPAPSKSPAQLATADPRAGDRILLVAVGDYLERSQMVLVELANAHASGPLDITDAQERASDLLSESRIYRQTAMRRGEAGVASVLDDLERVLMEISHAPSSLSEDELDGLRQRLEAEGILFKIRVLGSNVRNVEGPTEAEPPSARQRL
jgi:hypothetical protein